MCLQHTETQDQEVNIKTSSEPVKPKVLVWESTEPCCKGIFITQGTRHAP